MGGGQLLVAYNRKAHLVISKSPAPASAPSKPPPATPSLIFPPLFLDLPASRPLHSPLPLNPMPPTEGKSLILAVTGASGAVLAKQSLHMLASDPRVARVHLVVSSSGMRLLVEELGIPARAGDDLTAALLGSPCKKVQVLPNTDIGASIASGSYPVDAMLVIPCSMSTLAAISSGAADDLISRSADVCLKERRPVVLALRDTPFNRIHLENMLRAHDAGCTIYPFVPAFYHSPKSLDDLTLQYLCRVFAQLDLPQDKQFTWRGSLPENRK